eukprot:4395538-Amphidinium_carterae.1
MVDMWDVVSDDTGEEAFVQWICLLVSQGDDYAVFDASPGVKFMSRDAVCPETRCHSVSVTAAILVPPVPSPPLSSLSVLVSALGFDTYLNNGGTCGLCH